MSKCWSQEPFMLWYCVENNHTTSQIICQAKRVVQMTPNVTRSKLLIQWKLLCDPTSTWTSKGGWEGWSQMMNTAAARRSWLITDTLLIHRKLCTNPPFRSQSLSPHKGASWPRKGEVPVSSLATQTMDKANGAEPILSRVGPTAWAFSVLRFFVAGTGKENNTLQQS